MRLTLAGALLLVLGVGASPAAAAGPPVYESVDLTLVTLNRLRLEPARARAAGLLPKKTKELPVSVRVFLKPTGQLDFLGRAVGRAAARVRRAVAPGSRQKDDLRDSRRVAQAVGLWLDTHLTADAAPDQDAQPCMDLRRTYPSVSSVLGSGHANADERTLAAVALLRALKVPARVATARGRLVVQYWVAAQAPAASRTQHRRHAGRARAPKPPLGWWECMDPGVDDAEIAAWSLDPSSLDRLRWKPKQDLRVSLLGWEQNVFAAGDSPAAHAAFADSLALGRLTGTAEAQPLSAAAASVLDGLTQGSAVLWVLTAQHWRLSTEGVMTAMHSVQILTPYRPDLGAWGREQRSPVRALDLEAEGVWSDRPGRLRLHADLGDEWASPPPALGMLHWYELGLRRPEDVLQAERGSAGVDGVVLRADNLSPREGWRVMVSAEGTTLSAQTRTQDNGHFVLPLDPGLAEAGCLDVSVKGPGGEDVDFQRLLKEFQGTE